jgi:hypothetical protein
MRSEFWLAKQTELEEAIPFARNTSPGRRYEVLELLPWTSTQIRELTTRMADGMLPGAAVPLLEFASSWNPSDTMRYTAIYPADPCFFA